MKKRLRDVALKEEVKSIGSDTGMITLLGLTSSLSRLNLLDALE